MPGNQPEKFRVAGIDIAPDIYDLRVKNRVGGATTDLAVSRVASGVENDHRQLALVLAHKERGNVMVFNERRAVGDQRKVVQELPRGPPRPQRSPAGQVLTPRVKEELAWAFLTACITSRARCKITNSFVAHRLS